MLARLRSCSCTDCTEWMGKGIRENGPEKTCKSTMVRRILASSHQQLPLLATPDLLEFAYQVEIKPSADYCLID